MNWPRPSQHLRTSLALFAVLAACAGPSKRPNPVQQRGAQVYKSTCAVCHGEKGEGYKADRAPALNNPDFLVSANDHFLRSAIVEGRGGTTMSAFGAAQGGPLSNEDVDALISFLRIGQKGPLLELDERPAAGDAAKGGVSFRAECARCHGLEGMGGQDVRVGDPRFLHSASNGFLRQAIRKGRRDTAMAGFGGVLGDAGIEDVVAFLRSLESRPVRETPAVSKPIPLGPVPLNPSGPEPEGFSVYPTLTPADLIKAQLDRGAKLAILDARAPGDYAAQHISGAVSVPFYDPGPYLAGLPKDAWLVCYCACPHAESGQLAQKLKDNGFAKVTVLDEGLNVWRGKGYPVNSGLAP